MDQDSRLNDLLTAWRTARAAGAEPRVEDLCRDCPELSDRLRAAVLGLDPTPAADNTIAESRQRPAAGDTTSVSPANPAAHAAGPETRSYETGADGGPPADLPTAVGPYRVVGRLGRGGMGEVFEAEDPVLNRRVALKVMRPELAAFASARARFLREARAAAGLHHDHVVPIYHVGEVDSGVFIAMPLLPGETLAARLAREPRPGPGEVARIGRGVAAGLAAAHGRGMVHRDIKPSNLWLEAIGGGGFRVRILDFGLVQTDGPDDGLSQSGAVLGTPAYMSPEQADGQGVDARSDLFSLGSVLYEAATGRAPFHGPTRSAVLRAVADADPPPPAAVDPAVPPALSDLILRLLAKDPAARPATARDVVDEFDRMTVGGHRVASPITARPAAAADNRRPRRLAAVTAGVGLVVFGIVGIAIWAAVRGSGRGTADGDPSQPAAPIEVVGDAGSGRVTATTPEPVPRATMTVDVTRNGALGTQRFDLADPTAPLPVRSDDTYRVRLTVTPAAYVYVVRLAADGRALPVYPWAPGQWTDRGAERPVSELVLPATDPGYSVIGPDGGMETLVVVVRSTPFPESGEAAGAIFRGLPAQRQFRPDRPVAWFENSRLVSIAAGPDVSAPIDDPALQVQDFLSFQVQPRAQHTTAVTFARLARPKQTVAPPLSRMEIPPVPAPVTKGDDPEPATPTQRRAAALAEAVVADSRAGRIADAVEKQRQLLKATTDLYPKAQFPDGHPAVAAAKSSLGTLLFTVGRPADAEAQYRDALEMQRRLLGTDHPETLGSSSNLASALWAMGRHREAVPHFTTVLQSRRRVLGERHPTTAQSMSNLGVALRDSKEPEKAVPWLEQAVSIWTTLYPADRYPAGHPSLAMGLLNVGLALRDAGRPAEARPKVEQALAMRQRLFPADTFPAGHPDLAAAHQHLGGVLRDLKEFPRAVAELEASVAMYRQLQVGDHPSVARALRDLGDCLGRTAVAGDGTTAEADRKAAERAIPLLEEALAMNTRLFKGDHLQVADALAALGDALKRVGKPEQATEYLRRAEEMRKALGQKPATKP